MLLSVELICGEKDESSLCIEMSRLGETDFGLDAGEMERIKHQEAMKRSRKHNTSSKGKPFSVNLSREAQIAMQLARQDTVIAANKRCEEIKNGLKYGDSSRDSGYCKSDTVSTHAASSVSRKSVSSSDCEAVRDDGEKSMTDASSGIQSSFAEIYSRHQPSRLSRDITDENYKPEDDRKRALGGGKVESAMEIIEIVKHDELDLDTDFTDVDEEAIMTLARINSTEKCEVWMEATAGHQASAQGHGMDDEDDLGQTQRHNSGYS